MNTASKRHQSDIKETCKQHQFKATSKRHQEQIKLRQSYIELETRSPYYRMKLRPTRHWTDTQRWNNVGPQFGFQRKRLIIILYHVCWAIASSRSQRKISAGKGHSKIQKVISCTMKRTFPIHAHGRWIARATLDRANFYRVATAQDCSGAAFSFSSDRDSSMSLVTFMAAFVDIAEDMIGLRKQTRRRRVVNLNQREPQ